MRHRIKKIPSLISKYKSLHHRLLHSDKSTYNTYSNNTYFYKQKYFLKQHFPYSKPKTIPLVLPALTLLLVLGMMVFPVGVNGISSSKAYATWYDPNDTTSGSGDGSGSGSDGSSSVAITMLADDPIEQETPTEAGKATYRYNRFTVSADSVKSYKMFVYAADGYTNQLVNKPEGSEVIATVDTINSTANPNGIVGSSITADSWGYTITKGNVTEKADLEKLTYYGVGENTEVSPAISEDNSPTLSNSPFTVAFVANISKDKPAGHYQTEVLLSVAVEPEEVVTGPEYDKDQLTTKFDNFTYMQDPGLKDYCQNSSTTDKTSGQLVDGRDGKIYWVTKLAGTCWMTQDLDLDLGPNGPALTTENTGDNLYKGSATSWTGGKSVASSKSGWTTSYYDNVNWWERDNGVHKAEHIFLGNLYSYQAATAGTGSSVTSDGDEAPGSICPAGWKLPLSGGADVNKGAGSFNSLKDAGMNSNIAANSAPYYFQYGGYISSSLNGVDTEGNYWSATSGTGNAAYRLGFYTKGSLNTAYGNVRYCGFSVRCVIR